MLSQVVDITSVVGLISKQTAMQVVLDVVLESGFSNWFMEFYSFPSIEIIINL